jgi:D-alanine-D-alanine ligase
VLEHIDSDKYHINTIGITKQGNWFLTSSPTVSISDGTWEQDENNRVAVISPDRNTSGIIIHEKDGTFTTRHIDVIWPVLHGKNGEDGTMQGLLQISGIPYVGSGCTASSASMDKAITKAMVNQSGGVDQADCYVAVESEYSSAPSKVAESIDQYFTGRYPLFVKPANAGSSVGISKVKAKDELPGALDIAFREDDKVVVEEGIIGREIEVAVLGNDNPVASCIGEIFAANEFYDYEAKYQNAESRTGIVTDLDKAKETEVRDKAVRVYQIMGCKGLSRVDFFLQADGKVVFNEINTLPGFTSISMYPQLWEASGIEYSKLIDKLIELALEEHGQQS